MGSPGSIGASAPYWLWRYGLHRSNSGPVRGAQVGVMHGDGGKRGMAGSGTDVANTLGNSANICLLTLSLT